MSPRAKVQAGGILRKSLDNSWRTPESILSRARLLLGDPLPFDAATGPENPTGAARFCAGAPGRLFSPREHEALALTSHEILARTNGLEQSWDWPTWVNPPYGAEIRDWLAKIATEACRLPRRPIVALLPCSRWETSYFPKPLGLARAVCFHRGRVAFISSTDNKPVAGNPGASMLLGWNVDFELFREAFAPLGACFEIKPLAAGASS